MTTTDPNSLEDEGRQIRLVPLAPGVWTVLLGAGAMVLGPLFGFLIGTTLGDDRKTLGMSPIFLFLFIGFMVAGLGLGVILLGLRRILSHREEDSAEPRVEI